MILSLESVGVRRCSEINGFPLDTDWRLVMATANEVGRFKYIKQDIWHRLSAGTRLVADSIQNLDRAETQEIRGIGDKVSGRPAIYRRALDFGP